jgi:hypothetical protein
MTYWSPELVRVCRASTPTSWGLQCFDPAKSQRAIVSGLLAQRRLERENRLRFQFCQLFEDESHQAADGLAVKGEGCARCAE